MPASSQGTVPLAGRSPRVSKTMPITLWEAANESAEKWSGATLDVSDRGLRVVTGKSLHEGQVVSVFISETGLCLKRCRVIWTRPFRVPQMRQAGLRVME